MKRNFLLHLCAVLLAVILAIMGPPHANAQINGAGVPTLLVTHPTLNGAFSKAANSTIDVVGGPIQSIMVNSNDPNAVEAAGNGAVDLSQAGPIQSGAGFGVFGGPPVYPGVLLLGTDGEYVQPALPIIDPFLSLEEIQPAALPVAPPPVPVPGGAVGCPLPTGQNCLRYFPGIYPGGLIVADQLALFQPGPYYMSAGGFELGANGIAHMDSTASCADPDFGCGMLVFIASSADTSDVFSVHRKSGKVNKIEYGYLYPDGTGCAGNCLLGTEPSGAFRSVIIFQDRNATARTHTVEGRVTVRGAVYLTNGSLTSGVNYQTLGVSRNGELRVDKRGCIVVDRVVLENNGSIDLEVDDNSSCPEP